MRTVQGGRGSCQANFAACVMIIMPDMTFEGLLPSASSIDYYRRYMPRYPA